jgi:uncharacterized membrane protein
MAPALASVARYRPTVGTQAARGTRRHTRAGARVAVSAGVGVLAGLGASALLPWQLALLAGWSVASVTFVAWVWLTLGRLDAAATRRHATGEDPSRATADLLLVGSSVASLAGVALALLKGASAPSWADPVNALVLATVASSWGTIHTVFALRYADLYYRQRGGVEWNGDGDPDYRDFAYLAFTVGMTFQVSDTAITTRAMRRTVLRHALLSYLFGVVIIAATINVVAGLFRG